MPDDLTRTSGSPTKGSIYPSIACEISWENFSGGGAGSENDFLATVHHSYSLSKGQFKKMGFFPPVSANNV